MNFMNEFKRNREIFALKHILYQLYLTDWINNLSVEEKLNASLKYFDAMNHFEKEIPEDTFFEYIVQNGCNGKYPFVFTEFLQEKLYDYSYIHKLTNGMFQEKYEDLILLDKDLEIGE